ncbi:carbohydrate sulfotransferase 3-like [Mya arenaria]|uniref:carbohydrate sulfotransferase 3-like n=1 Tax=Mya arenaria TaxID=6604 RepID=UPI0022E39529|nr:carbohydrate sulfotransferase 3-like [Mya arenaria]
MVHSGKGKTRKSSIYAGNDTSLPRNANANINFSFKVLTNPEILSQTADATFTSKVNGKVKVIIILAYMHTGSTYLGDVLHQLPGSFYEYEPLRSLQQASRYRDAITFMNGSRKQLQRGKAVAYQLAAKAVEHMVTCNHRNLDYGTLLHAFRSISSAEYQDVAPYFRCLRSNSMMLEKRRANHASYNQLPFTNPMSLELPARRKPKGSRNYPMSLTDPNTILSCLPLLESRCRNATVRLTKFIRLSMKATEMLLRAINNMVNVNIIHLVRDPRAMMDSQLRKNDMGVKRFAVFQTRTKYMCSCLRKNLHLFKKLNPMYPNKFYSLRYEDLVDRPLVTFEDLLSFLGLGFGHNMERYVKNSSINYTPARAAVWREHISIEHLRIVDKYCRDLYPVLGYVPLDTLNQVRNLTVQDHIQLP